MNITDLINELHNGICTIEFTKIDTGEHRIMPCTLNQNIHKQSMTIQRYTSTDNIVAYGLDVGAWRDVRVNTIIKWYTGNPIASK
jgi:hypothetical protein|tara:strand:+ start:222 stop:476 length:255 start_codon:yes stop_codon:yes gene_type:complete